MDLQTAHILAEATTRFYAHYAASFSATRQEAWSGWERLAPYLRGAQSVIDLACGNRRFSRFLERYAPDASYLGIDNCPALTGEDGQTTGEGSDNKVLSLDLIDLALDGTLREELSKLVLKSDLVVCFGFFHHIPSREARIETLRTLLDRTAPDGTCIISLWRFMDDTKLATKAESITPHACDVLGVNPSSLDEGDFLLGWGSVDETLDQGFFRYCHHFSEEEIDELAETALTATPTARLIERFDADGREAPLNTYLVFHV